MTSKFLLTMYALMISSVISYSQASTIGLTVVTEEINKEITEIVKSERKVTTRKFASSKTGDLKANIWPNPSNLGKVRLSLENLPEEPLFIQIFNEREELIQEGVINGSQGSSLQHTLNFPDSSGTYSIKLSNAQQLVKDLELKIL